MSEEKKSGCLKYLGCGCIVIIILGVVAVIAAFYFGKTMISGMTDKYTEAKPRELPAPQVSAQEADAVIGRLNAFADAIKQDKPASELVLSAQDVNILVNRHPGLSKAAGKVNVQIDGDKINSDLSVPLGELSDMFKGKYLNGSAVLRVGMSSGRLTLFADSIEVHGEKIPDSFMKSFGAENLAEKANTDPKIAPILQKIDSITVKDGSIHVVPKNKQ